MGLKFRMKIKVGNMHWMSSAEIKINEAMRLPKERRDREGL